jgi:NitT/TauT family transport system substrate-binding protein
MAEQVSEAFTTKTPVNAATVWTDAYLPAKADLDILPKK